MSLVRYTHIHTRARARARFYYHTMCEGDIFLRQKKKEKGKKRKKKKISHIINKSPSCFLSLPPSLPLPSLPSPRASCLLECRPPDIAIATALQIASFREPARRSLSLSLPRVRAVQPAGSFSRIARAVGSY